MKTRSKRKSKSCDSSIVHPSKRSIDDVRNITSLQRVQSTADFQKKTMFLLQCCFEALAEGIWRRILPLDEDIDDIACRMGLEWDDLLPLLLHSGLVYAQLRSTVNYYVIDHSSWSTFCFTFQGSSKINKGYYVDKKRNLNRTYYLCRGTPTFHSPTKQVRAVRNRSFAYLEIRYPGNLSRQVSAHARELRKKSLNSSFNICGLRRVANSNLNSNRLEGKKGKWLIVVFDFDVAYKYLQRKSKSLLMKLIEQSLLL